MRSLSSGSDAKIENALIVNFIQPTLEIENDSVEMIGKLSSFVITWKFFTIGLCFFLYVVDHQLEICNVYSKVIGYLTLQILAL